MRGIDFAVSKQYLHLFYRHALVYGLRSQGTSELVRMHVFDARIVAEFAESGFNSADFQPFEGTMQGKRTRRARHPFAVQGIRADDVFARASK